MIFVYKSRIVYMNSNLDSFLQIYFCLCAPFFSKKVKKYVYLHNK